jgi:hypothetical protein
MRPSGGGGFRDRLDDTKAGPASVRPAIAERETSNSKCAHPRFSISKDLPHAPSAIWVSAEIGFHYGYNGSLQSGCSEHSDFDSTQVRSCCATAENQLLENLVACVDVPGAGSHDLHINRTLEAEGIYLLVRRRSQED